ncbi:hypothetical protein K523DRAFT_57923 [Schizophyllum commune Tattone D]|nr:hypothetical protein K523DRAFT_57923 [Schizophyllum commune Tattone D]
MRTSFPHSRTVRKTSVRSLRSLASHDHPADLPTGDAKSPTPSMTGLDPHPVDPAFARVHPLRRGRDAMPRRNMFLCLQQPHLPHRLLHAPHRPLRTPHWLLHAPHWLLRAPSRLAHASTTGHGRASTPRLVWDPGGPRPVLILRRPSCYTGARVVAVLCLYAHLCLALYQ